MRGFQAVCLKVAKQVSLKTAFCRFHNYDYGKSGVQLSEIYTKITDSQCRLLKKDCNAEYATMP
jgi:hypothetical protein